ncbi:MAG: HD domain-containing protein [Patescibacteria group bacterium]
MKESLTVEVGQILSFLQIARRLELTYRHTPKPENPIVFESDAEHSWSVALICLLVASRVEAELGVKLDQLKMFKMAIIHDLAEIKTGDTKTWDESARVGKAARERKALIEMANQLPEDLRAEIMSLWEECERKDSLEAMVVKSVDRLDPVIHRTVFDLGWENVEDDHATLKALDDRQLPRHQFSQVLTEIYIQVRDQAIAKGFLTR